MGSTVKSALARAVVAVCLAGAVGCNYPVDPGSVDPGGGGGGGGPTPTPSSTVKPSPSPAPTTKPSPSPTPSVIPSPSPTPTSPPSAQSCVSSDPNQQCLGLKIVSLVDPATGIPSLDEDDAQVLTGEMTKIWGQCNIGFQLELYQAVDPTTIGLSYGAASENQLNSFRRAFADATRFLVVITGPWTGSTIAWTTEGGSSGPYGTIVEKDYGHNPMTVGHELGHYMGLYHISNSSNLMNPYIGSNTSGLNSSQCSTARAMNLSEWQKMFRR